MACGINPGEMKVESVMTSDLITIDRGATVDEARQLMLKNRIKKLPITDPKNGKNLRNTLPHRYSPCKTTINQEDESP
ncbi:MAG: cyclic nucleotide-binding/CBS domain-containing protein [archaeon]